VATPSSTPNSKRGNESINSWRCGRDGRAIRLTRCFLVGGKTTPLKNDGVRQLGLLFPIYGEKNVPNHQPGFIVFYMFLRSQVHPLQNITPCFEQQSARLIQGVC
jgi:hypothetical protein